MLDVFPAFHRISFMTTPWSFLLYLKLSHTANVNTLFEEITLSTLRDRKQSNTRVYTRVLCDFVFLPLELRLILVPVYYFFWRYKEELNKLLKKKERTEIQVSSSF